MNRHPNALPPLLVVGAGLLLAPLPFAACTCQSAEDAAAKARLSQPPPPDPVEERAKEPLDAHALADDKGVRDRVNRMTFAEVHRRLGSLVLETEGKLTFTRAKLAVDASEKIRIVQAKHGDFSVHLVTGDGSEQRLAYVNEILFLKNNNGRWRASRDPTGERNELRNDSAAIWRSFYDLFDHALVFEKKGTTQHAGRTAVRYALSVPDQSAEAKALGAGEEPLPPRYVEVDGGPAPEDPKARSERVMRRLAVWRDKARPAGGKGELLVDEETGVVLKVRFSGKLAVGDEPTPAELSVRLTHDVREIGKDHEIPVPKDAIEEIVRKKWPTNPRKFLEDEGLVPPLPEAQGERSEKVEQKGG